MTIRCFISYRWADSQLEFARQLAGRLNRFEGIRSWIDADEFKAGLKLHDWLEESIRTACDVFVPIVTPEYLRGSTCQKELALATRLAGTGSKPIIPVLLAQCEIPLILGDLTWVDFRDVFGRDGVIDRSVMKKKTGVLVRSIRFHAASLLNHSRVRASHVRTRDDLWTHLLYRIHNEAKEWRLLEDFFPLFCDIVEDREMPISPEVAFATEFQNLSDSGYITVSDETAPLTHGRHLTKDLPRLVRIAPPGEAFVREAREEARRAGFGG